MGIIELKQITKEYRSDGIVTRVLNGIDLIVEKGEMTAVMGPSGSGKTTLLNIIGCMDVPTSGTYLYDGTDISRQSQKELAAFRGTKCAFVFQHFALIEQDTVFENVELPLLKHNMSRKERKQRVMNALQDMGIADLAEKRPNHISGGQKQRAAIARAIACGAEVILADEPTGALDSTTGKQIMEYFTRLNRLGKTVILITHDWNVAKQAERIIEIKDGRILKDEKNMDHSTDRNAVSDRMRETEGL
ncbi:MAG: ABC transporter ATP-binding protein [Bulleidia sp.]